MSPLLFVNVIEAISTEFRVALPWELLYGHVLRKEDNDWVKKCMKHVAEGSRPRGRPKMTWI